MKGEAQEDQGALHVAREERDGNTPTKTPKIE
jgi:hypothetical protein